MVGEGLCFVVRFCQLPEVAVDVVWITALGFQLNGHMFDAEIPHDPVLDQLQQLQRDPVTFDHDVAGEHDQPRLNGPDMEIVHILDAWDGLHGRGNLRRADARWRRFQQDLHRFSEDRPSYSNDRADDQQADERIQDRPSRQEYRAAADNDAERDPCVSDHVPERAPDVQIVFRSVLEQQGNSEIGHETDGCDDHDPRTVYGNRLRQPLQADDRDAERGQQEDKTVEKSRDDAGTMIAEGSTLRCWTCGEEMGIEGEKERPLIDEIMAGVAHESDAVEEPAADKLSRDDHAIDGQGQPEPRLEMCILLLRPHA